MILVLAMALMMMVVALSPALAAPYDFTYGAGSYPYDYTYGADSTPTDTTSTEDTLDVEDCRWVLFDDEWFLVCEFD